MNDNFLHKVHSGCHLKLDEVTAIQSEKCSDPKLDETCYLTRVFMRNNSTILTIANFSLKEEADSLVNKVANKISVPNNINNLHTSDLCSLQTGEY